jgi:DNA polymerase-3 subunit alpha
MKKLMNLGLDHEPYLSRLDEESQVIASKSFAPYFMIIKDLARWCRKNDIMVGPGRGSAAGSLMAYLLGITTVDPIKFNLLFSRFIAEDRIDFPDVDMDFPDYKRHLIREHLEELYGKNKISSISTFLTMKGRAVIRDVSRVFDIPIKEVDAFAKTIEYEDENGEGSLEEALKTTEGRFFASKYPDIIDHAVKLEGTIKSAGQHAAGVIISADDLTQGTKGNLVTRSNLVVSNWDMEDS